MMRVLCPHAKIIVHSHIVYPPMTLTWRAAHLVYQLFAVLLSWAAAWLRAGFVVW